MYLSQHGQVVTAIRLPATAGSPQPFKDVIRGAFVVSRMSIMATDILTSELKNPVDVAEYLFRRLYEVGVSHVHGVPGDYNLASPRPPVFLIEADDHR